MPDYLEQKFTSICTPAQVYLVFSIIFMIISSIKVKPSLKYIILHTLYIMFWILILNVICTKGYVSMAWFLSLFPFIILGFVLFLSLFKDSSQSTQSTSDSNKQ